MTLISEEEFNLLASEITNLSRKAETVVRKLIKNYDAKKRVEDMTINNLPGEEWRWVIGYEGLYQVSNKRRVKSFHHGKVKILRSGLNTYGYPQVSLCRNGENKTRLVHRLVAQAFIPNPDNKPEVDHMDNNRANACVENLQWVTSSENTQVAIRRGTQKIGSESPLAKLTAEEARYIRENYKPYDRRFGIRALARKLNVSMSTVADVVHHRNYKDVD